jgi:hypothetical protein
VTLGALHRHFQKDEEEDVVRMIFHHDKSDLRATLLAAKASLGHLLGLALTQLNLLPVFN